MRATTKSHSEYEMVYDKCPWFRVFAFDLYRPLLCFGVLRSPRDFGGRPDIQFQAVGITLEPIRNLYTWCQRVRAGSSGVYFWGGRKDWPGWWEAAWCQC